MTGESPAIDDPGVGTPQGPVVASRPRISREERRTLEAENRRNLEDDIKTKRLRFRSGPYEAHVQFTTFCNMSCIMCWDGDNPAPERMRPEVLDRLEKEVAPYLSIIVPYGGSEPLLHGWKDARRVVDENSIELDLTTNVQPLDEKKFREIVGLTQTLLLSVDSHIPEILGKIRTGGKPEKILQNTRTAARLCVEHGIECIANAVFLTENAPSMPETVAWFADAGVPTVNVIQLIDINRRSGLLDPLLHFSAEYVESIKQKCIATAETKHLRLVWNVAGYEVYDFRVSKIGPTARKAAHDQFRSRVRLLLPRYCRFAPLSLRVNGDGVVKPCCYATEGELTLGSLAERPFDEIWNGVEARDLRRAMFTSDLPSLCANCRFADAPPPEKYLSFVDAVPGKLGWDPVVPRDDVKLLGPDHGSRDARPPNFRARVPPRCDATWTLALALGGEADEIELIPIDRPPQADGTIEVAIADETWSRLGSNFGYWWTVFGKPAKRDGTTWRSTELWCVIRHESIPRIAGSKLGYPDAGHRPLSDLGGAKQAGWSQRDALPERPRLADEATAREAAPPAGLARRIVRRLRRAVKAVMGRTGPRRGP